MESSAAHSLPPLAALPQLVHQPATLALKNIVENLKSCAIECSQQWNVLSLPLHPSPHVVLLQLRLLPPPSLGPLLCQLAGAPALATLIPWIIYAHFFCFCLGVAPCPTRALSLLLLLFFFVFAFRKAKGVVCNFFKNKIFFISLLRWFSCNLRKTNKKREDDKMSQSQSHSQKNWAGEEGEGSTGCCKRLNEFFTLAAW